jgi:Cu(I)/Ag(I) efflux system membrane protein CusA/SilA
VGDVLNFIETAIGGENISTTVEGRRRFPIRVRFAKDYRDNVASLGSLLVPVPRMSGTPMENQEQAGVKMTRSTTSMGEGGSVAKKSGEAGAGESKKYSFIPLSQLAEIRRSPGPPMINSENSLLRSIVYLNVRGRDMGGFVADARQSLAEKLTLPSGYYLAWSGQYENQIRAKQRLEVLIPIVFIIIFVMLYFTFKSFLEAGMVMLSVPFALIGGVYLIYFLGYNFSVAVWVGFIALYGVAVETGVVMVIYLHEALRKRIDQGTLRHETIVEATIEGAVLRLRPKLMTVATNLIGLLPIMWSTGTGSDVMKPIAAPMIGGIVTSAIHVLFVTPVIFSMMKEHALKRGKLR